jgi:hypothetical protein
VLIPVLLEDVQVPGVFAAVNGANLTGWGRSPHRPHTEFNRLIRALLTLGAGAKRGEWTAERLARDTLRVHLDQENHTIQYTEGRLFVDGAPCRATANPLSYDRSFDFDLSDGSGRYFCRLVVGVSGFRGSVKHMVLSIGESVIYQG